MFQSISTRHRFPQKTCGLEFSPSISYRHRFDIGNAFKEKPQCVELLANFSTYSQRSEMGILEGLREGGVNDAFYDIVSTSI
jgi:hypothetical protein